MTMLKNYSETIFTESDLLKLRRIYSMKKSGLNCLPGFQTGETGPNSGRQT